MTVLILFYLLSEADHGQYIKPPEAFKTADIRVDLKTAFTSTLNGQRLLYVTIAIETRNRDKPVVFRSWGTNKNESEPMPTLRDEAGTEYAFNAQATRMVNEFARKRIRPNDWADYDMLVFDGVQKGVKRLFLRLPGGNLGLKKDIRFEIPISNGSVDFRAGGRP